MDTSGTLSAPKSGAKSIIWAVIVIVVILAIIFLGKGDKSESQSRPFKVGALLPLTGPVAGAAERAKNGIELALQDLEKEGKKVEVIYEDTQYDGKVGLSAYNKLRTIDNVDAVIVFGSPVAMPLLPVVNADKFVMLGFSPTPAYSAPDDYAFRIVGTADVEAKMTADTLIDKLGKKNIAVIYNTSDYGNGALAAFKKYTEGRATIVAEEGSVPNSSDFRAQLTKVKTAKPDAVFLAMLYKDGGTVMKQAKEMGFVSTFMCGQPCDSPDLFTAAGDAAEGLLVVAPTDIEKNGFTERYEQAFASKPSYITIRHYDAAHVLGTVAFECAKENYESDCLKKGLEDVKDFPGIAYPINFDENGDVADTFIIKQAHNGEYVEYK